MDIGALHLARPELLIIIPFIWIAFLWGQHGQRKQQQIQAFISPKLLPYLTDKYHNKTSISLLGPLLASVFVCGLAGISWEKQSSETYEGSQKTILLIDQSISMYATDIAPNRQTRMKQKVRDLLDVRQDGEIALVAFAGDAYVISPFSRDKETLTHFLLALDPMIMPLYGSNLSEGIQTSLTLIDNSDTPAHLIILTDDVHVDELPTIVAALEDHNVATDIIGIGTTNGGPIKLPEGQQLQSGGKIVTPVLPETRLKVLAKQLGGHYYSGDISDSEVQGLMLNRAMDATDSKKSDNLAITWIDQGHWFALPFLAWLFFRFRPGVFWLLLISFGTTPSPVQAEVLDWFRTPDQIAQRYVDNGDWQSAAELFKNPSWQAASQYALGNFEASVDQLSTISQSAEDFYNLGNGLAQAGKLDEAIDAYQKALEKRPEFKEAQENLDYLKSLSKPEQENDQSQQQQGDKDQNQNDDQDSQSADSSETDHSNQQKNDQSEDQQQPDDQQQEREQQDQEQHNAGKESDNTKAAPAQLSKEEQMAMEQWMRQIQDDPGGLLKRKLWYLHQEKRAENRYRQQDGMPIW